MSRSLVMVLFCFCSCLDPQPASRTSPPADTPAAPAPNTVVASDTVHIQDGTFDLYYSIEVIATGRSEQGVYEVLVHYGHNDASTEITMPPAPIPLIPEVRRGDPGTYIIGFRQGKDSGFHDYFLVRAGHGRTEMKYLKAYSFQ